MIIGVTGGVGAGKSTVLDFIQSLNTEFLIIKTDDLAKTHYYPNDLVYSKIVSYFGTRVLQENNQINFKKLANDIFYNEDDKKMLHKIVHPIVRQDIEKIIMHNKNKTIFIESAILFESNLDKYCDNTIYISVNKIIRTERLQKSRNYSKSKIDQIIAQQMSEQDFETKCNFILVNENIRDMQLNVHNILSELNIL